MSFICALSLLRGVTGNTGTLKTAEACQEYFPFVVIKMMCVWGGGDKAELEFGKCNTMLQMDQVSFASPIMSVPYVMALFSIFSILPAMSLSTWQLQSIVKFFLLRD